MKGAFRHAVASAAVRVGFSVLACMRCGAEAQDRRAFTGTVAGHEFSAPVVAVQVQDRLGLLADTRVDPEGSFFFLMPTPGRGELQVLTGSTTEIVGVLQTCSTGTVVDLGELRPLEAGCRLEVCAQARSDLIACTRRSAARCQELSAQLEACHFDGLGRCDRQRRALDRCEPDTEQCVAIRDAFNECIGLACASTTRAFVEAECARPCQTETGAERAACDACRAPMSPAPLLAAPGCSGAAR